VSPKPVEKVYEDIFFRVEQLERENAALRDALNTALGIEYLDEEVLEKLIERLRLIIQEQKIPPKDSKL